MCHEAELSLVGDPSYDGYSAVGDLTNDEFLSACDTNDIINMCTINSIDDPFSDLFPSLISV